MTTATDIESTTSPDEVHSQRVRRWVDIALVSVAAVAIAGWLFLGISHIDDRYGVLHVQGAWMALARNADEGVLYPPLYDGERYGGTRWMPLPIVVNAGAAKLTGDYLTSGKIVGFISTAVLLVLVFLELWRLSVRMPIAAALTATVVATKPGLFAGTSIGGDVIPVVLQLGAMMVATSRRRHALAVAGVLAALALASKTTGVWALLAIATWLALDRRWRDLALFGGTFAVSASVLFGIVQAASDGRFIENVALLTLAGVGGGVGPIRAPNQLLYQMYTYSAAVWLLMPFAVITLFVNGRRRIGLSHLALFWALVLLIITYTDVGSGFNQLLDVAVLTILVAGSLAERSGRVAVTTTGPLVLVLALAVIWGAGSGVVLTQVPDIRATIERGTLGYPVEPLRDLVRPGDEILSEDPYVPLSFGREPVVLDPFMLLRLDRVDPEAVDELIDRIEEKRFGYLVMITSLERRNDYWWNEFHFGPRVVDAMRRSYVLQGRVDSYHVYRPAP